MTIYDACELGRIDLLEQWKAEGTLPDLMDEYDSASQWFPHEISVRYGQLDTLKWLVNESGQQIDLTVCNHRVVVSAAAYERIDVLRWLILESSQPVLVKLDDDSDWYKSGSYDNDIITFIEAVNSLHVAGVSIERIQRTPGIVQLVEDGRLSPEIVSKLSDSDIDLISSVKAATAKKMTRRI